MAKRSIALALVLESEVEMCRFGSEGQVQETFTCLTETGDNKK